ncbi:hypothetical protein SpCBS45565_g07652 [Spizellomyces sp. 'palustris']|nr:hypothetical protein SpCBS45565_g07652 [Spizellomyces sp. 'palustris']
MLFRQTSAVYRSLARRSLATLHPLSPLPTSPVPSQFVITPQNGFLPIQDPLAVLPESFDKLESLLQRMPLRRYDTGKPGLLATGEFGRAVESELPVYDVSKVDDSRLLTALFRDYTFAASAYLLEPCDIMHRQRGDYGLGRDRLPRSLAVPLTQVAQKLHAKPFMEYAQSYSLYNYKRLDPTLPATYENLDLIRGFSGMDSEHGFILVHVSMVSHTGDQIKHTLGALEAISQSSREGFNSHLAGLLTTMQKINAEMETMWIRSSPGDYTKFRTFIMGTKNQPMFPRGVVYEGVSEQPTFYRGESGANDSIVPSLDNFLQVTERMPGNPLTEILKDFRSYRPENHSMWLTWLEGKAKELDVRGFALKDPNSAVLYLALLDQLRDFRARHWNFTKTYILKNTRHPTATGGSPIVTWLPNQLSVVLTSMTDVLTAINNKKDDLTFSNRVLAEELGARAETQQRVLEREVRELKEGFVGQDAGEVDWTREMRK